MMGYYQTKHRNARLERKVWLLKQAALATKATAPSFPVARSSIEHRTRKGIHFGKHCRFGIAVVHARKYSK